MGCPDEGRSPAARNAGLVPAFPFSVFPYFAGGSLAGISGRTETQSGQGAAATQQEFLRRDRRRRRAVAEAQQRVRRAQQERAAVKAGSDGQKNSHGMPWLFDVARDAGQAVAVRGMWCWCANTRWAAVMAAPCSTWMPLASSTVSMAESAPSTFSSRAE